MTTSDSGGEAKKDEEDKLNIDEGEGGEEGDEDDDDNDDDDDADDDDDDEDDDLVLEGVVVRNLDVSDEDDDDENYGDDKDDESDKDRNLEDDERRPTASDPSISERKSSGIGSGGRVRKKRKPNDEVLAVDFTFCDMDEKYFHGLKSLIHSTSSVYHEHSSALADLMIENVAVGTVVGTSLEDSNEADVFGFASVLNVTSYQKSPAIQFLKQLSLDHCPPEHAKDLGVALSGKTNRPAGFFLHGRMINMPMEIVLVLHQQLVLDMDWAVDNADVDTEAERKALDFGAFVRLAPCHLENRSIVYKYFDDEIFAQNAEFSYTLDVPRIDGTVTEKQRVCVMVLTKTGHRAAMADLSKLIHGSSSSHNRLK
jgi:BCCIP